jgi:hypothetical protein
MRDTRFNFEARIHKESYILIEGFTKNRVSLDPFLTQDVLELLTITTRVIQIFQDTPHKAVAQEKSLII